jgi:ANTAR domain
MTGMSSMNGPRSLGRFYAVPAAIAVQNAQVLAQTQRLAAQLQSALEARGVIDRAIGIMMCRSGGTEDQALARLRALSQNEHHKLAVVARQIIDDAVRRPRPSGSGRINPSRAAERS